VIPASLFIAFAVAKQPVQTLHLQIMNIGFDAKRAYHNQTGLGHYSRTLIHSLANYFPDQEYFLFNPKPSSLFLFEEENIHEVLPRRFPSTFFRSAWRSS